MGVALSMEGSFGFGLQTVKGTYVEPATWLPLMVAGTEPADTLELKKNYVLLDMADGKEYQTSYYSAGEWAEGGISFPLIPGSLTSLFSWVQDRDADNQGKWGSVLVDCVNTVKKVTDAKVRRATIDLLKGKSVTCGLDLCALKMETGLPGAPSMPADAPYIFREVSVQIAKTGGALSADVNCESIRIEIDNMVEDPEDGFRLGETVNPQQLYNLAGVRCSGAFSRDFVDSAVYADFVSGQEAALLLTLERGAATATISLPRVLYSGSNPGLPGSHSRRIVEEIEFVALGSADGVTPPVVLA